jgi:hypothetical protein
MRGKLFVEILNANDFVNSGSFFTSQILPHIITLTTTLIAAFLGAWFAFKLSKRENDKAETKKDLITLNQVIIHFIQQWNELLTIKEKHIKSAIERAGEDLLWMHLEAILFMESSIFEIDSSSLHFLMDSGSENIIQEIFMERTGYKQIINLVNFRSEKHRGELQKRFEEFNQQEVKVKNDAEYEQFIGERLTFEMKSLTQQIVEGLEISIKGHYDLIMKLNKVGKEIFPDEKVLTVKINEALL